MPEIDPLLVLMQSMDTKIDRNFDLLVQGQKSLFAKFTDHEAEDNRKFEEIHVKAATDAGEAKATAKLWTGVGFVGALLTGGGFEYLKHYMGWK